MPRLLVVDCPMVMMVVMLSVVTVMPAMSFGRYTCEKESENENENALHGALLRM